MFIQVLAELSVKRYAFLSDLTALSRPIEFIKKSSLLLHILARAAILIRIINWV